MSQVFLSYARSDDEPFVKQLYEDLIKNGIKVWWDREKMENRGRTFLQELRDAIEDSDRLIAIVGTHAVESDYVKAEWDHAFALIGRQERSVLFTEEDLQLNHHTE